MWKILTECQQYTRQTQKKKKKVRKKTNVKLNHFKDNCTEVPVTKK